MNSSTLLVPLHVYLVLINSSDSSVLQLKLVVIVLEVFGVTFLLNSFLDDILLDYYLKRNQTLQSIFINVIKTIIFLVPITIALYLFTGVGVTSLFATLGIGGLAVALALQDTLGNMFAGINIIASKHYKVGDYVRLSSGEEGYIKDINWRHVTIHNLENNLVIVPNSHLSSVIVTNFNLPVKEMRVFVACSVTYDRSTTRRGCNLGMCERRSKGK